MSQRAIDIVKVSDLKAVKRGNKFEWVIDGIEFVYQSGDNFLLSQTGTNSQWETWPLMGNTKTAANRKIFELIK